MHHFHQILAGSIFPPLEGWFAIPLQRRGVYSVIAPGTQRKAREVLQGRFSGSSFSCASQTEVPKVERAKIFARLRSFAALRLIGVTKTKVSSNDAVKAGTVGTVDV
jgi:hypothetical protein